MVSNTFPVLICSLYILSVKMSFLITCSFLIGRFLYCRVWEFFTYCSPQSLLAVPFANYFPPDCTLCFLRHCMSSCWAKLLNGEDLFRLFFFLCHAFDIKSEHSLLSHGYQFSLMFFSPQTFLISCFTFNSVVHFEFIFIRGGRFTSRLIFFPLLFSVYGRPIAPMPFIEKAVSFIDLCVCSSAKTAVAVGGLGIGWRESSHFFSVKIV